MALIAVCGCGKVHEVDESKAGRTGRCKACGETFSVPSLPSPVVTPPKPRQGLLWAVVCVQGLAIVGLIGLRLVEPRAGAVAMSKRIEVEELVLVDEKGEKAAVLGFDQSQDGRRLPNLSIYDRGAKRISLRVESTGWAGLSLTHRDGIEAVGVHARDNPTPPNALDPASQAAIIRVVGDGASGVEIRADEDNSEGPTISIVDSLLKRLWRRSVAGKWIGQ